MNATSEYCRHCADLNMKMVIWRSGEQWEPATRLNAAGYKSPEQRRYADALAAFDRMTAAQVRIDRYSAACCAQLGRRAEARTWATAALGREPRFTLRRYAMVEPRKSPADLAHLIDGMRKAGLPE
jgi:hypothetical protein